MVELIHLQGIQILIQGMGTPVLHPRADGVLEVLTSAHRNSIPGRFAHIRA
jgi:hypothetical protein